MKYLAVAALMFLSSCDAVGVAGALLSGGGPNVAANVQAGKENTQGVAIKNEAPRTVVRPRARVDTIDQRVTNIEQTPLWIVVLLVLGWLAPSPNEIARSIASLFKRKD